MKKQFEAKKLGITEDRPGLSLKMLKNHFTLYEGYVKKTNEIEEKLETADRSKANGVYSEFGELKRQETFAVNGMKLHELYFQHITTPQAPTGDIVTMIEQEFGTLENWKADFIATGLSARGWAILAFDMTEKRLHNYASDAHNVGAVWGAIPLIALDVYEHAYFIDYGVGRKEYIDAFFTNLNWQHANTLIAEYQLKHI
jgi:Fe-Mn family superoxide dismutase